MPHVSQPLAQQKKMSHRRSELQDSPYTWYWPFQVVLFYACLLVLGLTLLTGSLLCVVLNGLLSRDPGVRVGRWLIGMSFRSFLALAEMLGLMRLDLKALDALNAEQGLVIAPNHPSMLDALLIISRLPQTCCIMKAELWDNIFLGAGARLAGYIRNDSIKSMIRLSAAELQAGGKLLMFPEGTRTVRQPVNRLKGGIVLIAQTVQSPIQTIILQTNSPYLSKSWHLLKAPSFPLVYRARLGRRFEAKKEIRQTLDAMQHYYENELGQSATPAKNDAA
jgi:1-acyl-sn-glycerol-3-phosphate acyltransferase